MNLSRDEAKAVVELAPFSKEMRLHLYAALDAGGKLDHAKCVVYDECPHCRAMFAALR